MKQVVTKKNNGQRSLECRVNLSAHSCVENVASYIRSLICLVFLFVMLGAAGQTNYVEKTDSLLGNYAERFAKTKLHLHIDKSIYTPNETIWFSAYLYSIAGDTFPHQLLYVKLLRNDDDSIIRSSIFPIVQNHSYGQFLLPTAIPVGTYKLLAYTDALADGLPVVTFRQQLQIKTDAQPEFTFQLHVLDSIASGRDSFRVLLKGVSQSGQPLQNAAVQYELSGDGKQLLKNKITLDDKGEAYFLFPRLSQKQLYFKSQLQVAGKKQSFNVPVQQPIEPPQVRFYPEGGTILAGLPANLPVEVIGAGGLPIRCIVELVENGQPVQNIETNAHGIGIFKFTPQLNGQYEARISVNNIVQKYPLPSLQAKGYALHVEDGVIEDSIRVIFQRKDVVGKSKLLVHNFKRVFWAADINAQKDQFRFSIPANLFPTGLYALTLTSESMQPLSERLVFVQQDQKAVTLKTNKTIYQARENVSLSVQVDSLLKTSLQQLSFSCVALSRLDFEVYTDLLTGIFLKDELADFSGSALYFLREQKQRLNEILLTRGWRQYRWENLQKNLKPVPKISALHPTKGRVLMDKQKGPFEIALFSDNNIIPYTTDSAGNFTLALNDMISPMDKRLFLAPIKQNNKKQKPLILMDTLYKVIDKRINAIPLSVKEPGKRFISFSHQDILPVSPDAKSMAVVIVAAKSKTSNFVSKTGQDWVCQYNILNCDNHPFGGVPSDGEKYLYREMRGAATKEVVYIGCESVSMVTPKEFVSVPRISIGKEFYKPTYDAMQTSPPEFLTTLYWNPLLKMEKNTFQDSFFTSDTKGVFLCIINGLIDGRPVQSYQQFEVK